MDEYIFPYFGKTNNNELSLGKVNNSNSLGAAISINFFGEYPSNKQINDISAFLEQIPLIIENTKVFLINQLSNNSKIVLKYLEYLKQHSEIKPFIDNESEETIENQLINKLFVSFIFIYPNSDYFATLEFCIDKSFTKKYLLVSLDELGTVKGIEIDT